MGKGRRSGKWWRRSRMTMAILALVLCAAGCTALMFLISPAEGYVCRSLALWSGFLIPLLNWLPVFLLMLALFLLTSNVVLSVSAVNLVMVLMALTNRVKLDLRGDPLLHWDFALAQEALSVIKGFGWKPIALAVGCMVAYLAVTALLMVWIKPVPIRWKRRVAALLGCAVAMFGANGTLYSNTALYDWLPVWGSFYNMADVHNSKGNLYAFLYNWNTSRSEKPEGYDEAETAALIRDYARAHEAVPETASRPNIIMIMGEALSDISRSDAVSFDGYRDPLLHFTALGEAGIQGRLVVPSRGGGTADTEYDVLTARAARCLRGVPYAYQTVTREIDALPSLLKKLGYRSFALHPGYGWFYNRQNVYRNLGFDTSVFEDAFPRAAYLDTFISEEATYDKLLEMIDGHLGEEPAAPLFGFCLTIQNHAAYLDRYLPAGTYNFTPTVEMSPMYRNILSNYFAGEIDADTQLMRLAAYLEGLEEPFVLVCFGDHLPALDEELYDLLIPGADAAEGTYVAETRLYTVPYIIWQNSAAREADDLVARAAALGMSRGDTMSSNYFGAYLLELLGYDGLSGFFSYANETRADFPVLMEGRAFQPDGCGVEEAGEAQRERLQNYRHWMYYLTDKSM